MNNMMYDSSEVPEWLRFAFLQTGYRRGGGIQSNLLTLFSWHNQTVNAWTMILVSVFSISAFSFLVVSRGCDILPFACLTIAAIIHIPFTLGYHLLMPISKEVYVKWRHLDSAFIFIGLCFLCFGLSYYIFPMPVVLVLTGISTVVAYKSIKNIQCVQGAYNKKKQAKLVATMIMVCLCPLLCTCIQLECWLYMAIIIGSFVVGGYIYAEHIPERFFPRTFDYIGSSHNIMHVCILMAHVVMYIVVYKSSKF